MSQALGVLFVERPVLHCFDLWFEITVLGTVFQGYDS